MEYNFLEIILLLKIKIIKNNHKTLIETNITKLDWCLLFDYKIYNHVLRAVDPESESGLRIRIQEPFNSDADPKHWLQRAAPLLGAAVK